MSVSIERRRPRNGVAEHPLETDRGFELVDRRLSDRRHHVENSTFVRSIEEAAYLVEQGFAIRMTGPGLRPSLIAPDSLKIIKT